MQSISPSINSCLEALKKATDTLYELSVDLSLLDGVSEMTLKVSQAVDEITAHCQGFLTEDELMDRIAGSGAIEILDEIVDIDAISELENSIFNALEDSQNPVINEFLSQLIEKTELRYTRFLEAIHALNALFD